MKYPLFERVLSLAVATSVSAILISCGPEFVQFGSGKGQNDPRKDLFRRSTREVQDATSRLLLMKLRQFSDVLIKRENRGIYDSLMRMDVRLEIIEIYRLIEDFKKHVDVKYNGETPYNSSDPASCEWWNEMWNRRALYCDEHYCRLGAMGEWWDMRHVPALLQGPPDFETSEDGVCQRLPYNRCIVYRQEWVGRGIRIAYEGSVGDAHPEDMIAWTEGDSVATELVWRSQQTWERAVANVEEPAYFPHPNVDRILRSRVRCTAFPNHGGLSELWVHTMTRGDQFTLEGENSLTVQVSIYDSLNNLVFAKSRKSSLEALKSVSDVEDVWFSQDIRNLSLPDGEYHVRVMVSEDATQNKGFYACVYTVPTALASNASDILLYSRRYSIYCDGAFQRGRTCYRTDLLDCKAGDTANLYLEVIKPAGLIGEVECVLEATLWRLRDDSQKGSVTTGPVLETWVEDGIGVRPFGNTQPDSAKVGKKGKRQRKKEREFYSLLADTVHIDISSSDSLQVSIPFDLTVEIPVGISNGRYGLVVTIHCEGHGMSYQDKRQLDAYSSLELEVK